MDIQTDNRNRDCEGVKQLKYRRLVVGTKQLKKALNAGRATEVFLAEDADPAITEPIEALCQLQGVSCTWVRSMRDLGHACGIEVGAAAAAAVD